MNGSAAPLSAPPAAVAAPAVVVPQYPLARRMRSWFGWLLVAGLLAWSWNPAEMFRAGSLITDWRNMAEFGQALQGRLDQLTAPHFRQVSGEFTRLFHDASIADLG